MAKKPSRGAREMAQGFRVIAVRFIKPGWGLFLRTHAMYLASTCNPSCRGSYTLFWSSTHTLTNPQKPSREADWPFWADLWTRGSWITVKKQACIPAAALGAERRDYWWTLDKIWLQLSQPVVWTVFPSLPCRGQAKPLLDVWGASPSLYILVRNYQASQESEHTGKARRLQESIKALK